MEKEKGGGKSGTEREGYCSEPPCQRFFLQALTGLALSAGLFSYLPITFSLLDLLPQRSPALLSDPSQFSVAVPYASTSGSAHLHAPLFFLRLWLNNPLVLLFS